MGDLVVWRQTTVLGGSTPGISDLDAYKQSGQSMGLTPEGDLLEGCEIKRIDTSEGHTILQLLVPEKRFLRMKELQAEAKDLELKRLLKEKVNDADLDIDAIKAEADAARAKAYREYIAKWADEDEGGTDG